MNAEEQAEHRTTLIKKLTDVRALLHELEPKLAKLKAAVFTRQAEENNFVSRLQVRNDDVSTWLAARPRVADYLPDDPEAVDWQAALEARQAKVEELHVQHRALPNLYELRAEGVELTQRIQGLHFEENNLLNALAGRPHNEIATGSVRTVF